MKNLFAKKKQNKKIVAVSCYTAPVAAICAKHCEILLVGDTVGMTIYGHKDTKSVTLDMMIQHGKAVRNAAPNNFMIVDMPYGSYESDKIMALHNARKLLSETKADALKLEGGVEIEATLCYLKDNGVNVVGHIGLLPQQLNHDDKYRVQGRDREQKEKIQQDLNLLLSIGVEMIIIECVYKDFINELISNKPAIFIGIGASDDCDGQILVSDDIFGLTYGIRAPKFSKSYVEGSKLFEQAISEYSQNVRDKKFPTKDHLYYLRK